MRAMTSLCRAAVCRGIRGPAFEASTFALALALAWAQALPGRAQPTQIAAPSVAQSCRQSEVFGWVATLPQAHVTSCPAPSRRWQLQTFALDAEAARTLCRYEWQGTGTPTRTTLPIGLEYTPDCMAIGVRAKRRAPADQPDPQSRTDAELETLQAQYLAAVDAPVSRDGSLPRPVTDGHPSLVFIDALPSLATGPQAGSLQHGNSLAAVARLLGGAERCTEQPCRFRFGWYGRPALFPNDSAEVVGSPLDSAHAISTALTAFERGDGEHLVLSMGLGFEADAKCAALPDSPVVQALREAIRKAACEADAVVLAPVGNQRPDDVTHGMLYPAAFEAQELVCDGEPQGRPLVVAVSGVDLERRPLPSSRASARWMTIGGPFAHPANEPSDRLMPRQASSVAVATSGPVLALGWWLRPDLQAKDLIDGLFAGAVPAVPNVPGSRVIEACASLAALCGDPSLERCAALSAMCPEPKPAPGFSPAILGVLRPAAPAERLHATPQQVSVEPSSCVGRGQRIDPSFPGR